MGFGRIVSSPSTTIVQMLILLSTATNTTTSAAADFTDRSISLVANFSTSAGVLASCYGVVFNTIIDCSPTTLLCLLMGWRLLFADPANVDEVLGTGYLAAVLGGSTSGARFERLGRHG